MVTLHTALLLPFISSLSFPLPFPPAPFQSKHTPLACLMQSCFSLFQGHSLRAGQVLLWACSSRHIPSKYNLPSFSLRGLQGRIIFSLSFFLVFFSQVASFPLISNCSPADINLLVLIFHGTSGDAKNYRFWNFTQGFYSVILEWGLGAQEWQPQHVGMYWEPADVQHPCTPPGVSIGE